MDDDRDFEHAPLSGSFNCDAEMIDVEIYRYASTQDPWQSVVVDLSSGRFTAWSETFTMDEKAYQAFAAMVEADGMTIFVGAVSPVRH